MATNRSSRRRGSSTSARSSSRSASRVSRITRRVVNTRRHTQGYIVNGRFLTVQQAAQLAAQGRLSGVRRVGNHIQANNGGRRLVSLPTEVRRGSN